ncbi:LAME_0D01552g1_1 [Lachancea meyersii CBS 8951]|uniref:Mitochondrial morphogenesis protein SLD7 n=1 Tax=Lachancea meyersii CBS 8951 TaxID=1266667 RepID=A0A1G4J767_9SACH|nr:LAME_0D01552g1_1 [Lachancea meyersii CBS 8951]
MKLDLGDGTIVLDVDLQLNNSAGDGPQKLSPTSCARVLAYIDRLKLPLWVLRGAAYTCWSESPTTAAYFRSKLLKKRHVRRGIIASHKEGHCMFYASQPDPEKLVFEIYCVELDILSCRHRLDLQLPKSTGASGEVLDNLVARRQQRQLRSRSQVSTHAQFADVKRQFVKTAASCIRSGLRLRGMPEAQPEFQLLYKTTLSTVEFAHRHDLNAPRHPVPFELVQESVETVLRLFTGT